MSLSEMPTSAESHLDKQINLLVAKVVSGTATKGDEAKLQELMQLRQSAMRSPILAQIEKLRRLRGRSAS